MFGGRSQGLRVEGQKYGVKGEGLSVKGVAVCWRFFTLYLHLALSPQALSADALAVDSDAAAGMLRYRCQAKMAQISQDQITDMAVSQKSLNVSSCSHLKLLDHETETEFLFGS